MSTSTFPKNFPWILYVYIPRKALFQQQGFIKISHGYHEATPARGSQMQFPRHWGVLHSSSSRLSIPFQCPPIANICLVRSSILWQCKGAVRSTQHSHTAHTAHSSSIREYYACTLSIRHAVNVIGRHKALSEVCISKPRVQGIARPVQLRKRWLVQSIV